MIEKSNVHTTKTPRRLSAWTVAMAALVLCCLAGFVMPSASTNTKSTGAATTSTRASSQTPGRGSPTPEALERARLIQQLRDMEARLKTVKASLEVSYSKDLYNQYLELSQQIADLRRQLYGQSSDRRPVQSSHITPNVTQCINGALAGDDPTFNRPLTGTSCSLSAVGTAVFYDVYELTKTCAGTVTVSLAGSGAAGCGAAASHDSFLVVYQAPDGSTGAFNPASSCTNFIEASDDDIGDDPEFTTTASLVAGTYYVVVTSFGNGTTGTYDLFVDDACPDDGGGGDCEPCTPDSNAFDDPSIEQEDLFWTSTSTNFGSSICSDSLCGDGLGTAVPRTGLFFAWFGGVFPAAAETGTLSQTVTIPTGTTATLTFFLRIGAVETPFTDTLNVRVDGTPVGATITEPATAEAAYTQRTYDLSAFADGAAHMIELRYVSSDGLANFTVDDLQLEIVCPPCEGDCTNPNVALLVADTTNSRVQKFTVGDGMPTTSDVGPINGTFGTGDPGCPSFTTGVQDGRIFRDGIPSVCPTKVYPGIFGDSVGTNFNFDAYTFVNNMAATQCITVNFDPNMGTGTPCGTNAHASAYLTSYNPANQATNFLGDVGSSITQPFSFEVPANATFLVVVTNTASQATCSYQFTVVGDVSCGEGAPQGDWSVLMPAGTTVGKVKNPKGVTQTADGVNIYVADTGNNRIQKSTDSGVTWAILPNTTAAPLGFKAPAAVAVEPDDPNVVYVADTGNNRVLASSDGGASWSLLAGTGSNPNQVRGPEGMVVDCDGNLWIADTLNNRIVAYAAAVGRPGAIRVPVSPGTGVVVAGFGSALNQVRAPKGVTVDVLTGDLYVADTANNRITHYINGPVLSPVALGDASLVAPTGSALGQVRGPAGITVSGGAAEMMVPRAGFNPKVANTGVVSLVIGDTLNNRIQRAEIMTTTQVGTFSLVKGSTATQTATVGSLVGQFRAPTGVR